MSPANPRRDHRDSLRGLFGLLAHSPRWREIGLLCLYEVTYFVAYHYGMSFSQASAAPFWFPDAILLCALLVSRKSHWWILVLAPLPIRLFTSVAEDVPLWFLLAAFAIDGAKGLLAAAILRKFAATTGWMRSVPQFAIFCLFAVLLIPAVSAFGGAAIRSVRGSDFWVAWEQWFLGDATAQLVLTPAILFWIEGGRCNWRQARRQDWIEGGLLAMGLMLACQMAFAGDVSSVGLSDARFYAPVPFLFWAAIRFGMLGATAAISILTVATVTAAITGQGPFTGHDASETARALQNFLLLRAAPVYLVAVSIDQRRRVERALRESE
ncbi:MAG TPA: MASE1 domain-containing protein, partial [Steroidobacteraceae bacterium]